MGRFVREKHGNWRNYIYVKTRAIGCNLSVGQMRSVGLYISEPRSDAESPSPFAEPGLFVINGDGALQMSNRTAASSAL